MESNNKSKSNSKTESEISDVSSTGANLELGNEFLGKVIKNESNNNLYLITNKLGCGNFSSVWIGYSLNDHNLVGIKIYHPNDYKDSFKEIDIFDKINKSDINKNYLLTMIEHFNIKNIETCEEYYNDDNEINPHKVIILPLLACSTYDLLQFECYEDGLPSEMVKLITVQLILGLIEFEKLKLIHTDLKPENILIEGMTLKMKIILDEINKLQIDKLNNDSNIDLINDKLTELIKTIEPLINNDESDMILPEYLNNIRIKLCDFNLAVPLKKKLGCKYSEIQTRYYRAPEVILGSGIHKKTDYWSIPCLMFELLTGDLLFDPDKDELRSRDVHHLYQIIELVGKIPPNMINNASNRNDLFKYGKLIGTPKDIKLWPLKSVLKEKYEIDIKKIKNLIDVMESLLCIDPSKRPDLIDVLNKF